MKTALNTALLAAALLAGCATVPPEEAARSVSGRLALQSEQRDAAGNDPQAFSAQFELRGDARLGQLSLSGPLGNTLAQARWQDADGAELLTRDGTRRFVSLDAMSQELLGQPLPLAALIDWVVRGRPWAGARSYANDAGFEQLGWQVDLSRQAEGLLVAQRREPPVLTVRVRLDRPAAP